MHCDVSTAHYDMSTVHYDVSAVHYDVGKKKEDGSKTKCIGHRLRFEDFNSRFHMERGVIHALQCYAFHTLSDICNVYDQEISDIRVVSQKTRPRPAGIGGKFSCGKVKST